MKYVSSLLLLVVLLLSCNNPPAEKEAPGNVVTVPAEDTATLQKLAGEWVFYGSLWGDSVLTFRSLADTPFHHQEMPSYNAYTFNAQSNTIETNIYGAPGCGLGAIQNKPDSANWQLTGRLLHLRFLYSNNEGDHLVDRQYNVERSGDTLQLRWVQ